MIFKSAAVVVTIDFQNAEIWDEINSYFTCKIRTFHNNNQ